MPFVHILPSGQLTWQWNMNLLKMYSLMKIGINYPLLCLITGVYVVMSFTNRYFFSIDLSSQ